MCRRSIHKFSLRIKHFFGRFSERISSTFEWKNSLQFSLQFERRHDTISHFIVHFPTSLCRCLNSRTRLSFSLPLHELKRWIWQSLIINNTAGRVREGCGWEQKNLWKNFLLLPLSLCLTLLSCIFLVIWASSRVGKNSFVIVLIFSSCLTNLRRTQNTHSNLDGEGGRVVEIFSFPSLWNVHDDDDVGWASKKKNDTKYFSAPAQTFSLDCFGWLNSVIFDALRWWFSPLDFKLPLGYSLPFFVERN